MKKILPLLLVILIVGAIFLSACTFPQASPDTETPNDGEVSEGGGTDTDGESGNQGNENDGNNSDTIPDDDGKDTEDEDEGERTVTESDPYVNVVKEDFYANYTPAKDYMDAYYRTQHGLMSGDIVTPDQAPNIADYRPTKDDKYIRNINLKYLDDGNTFVLTDAYGKKVKEIYKDGAYITLDEVAAYVYAFGNVPANYSSSKSTKPTASIWGEYLRVNNSKFTGDTSKYPYEPELPRISGCGGDLTYYEIDIGTTGTDCDPSYTAELYNNGTKITRGAARIVYVRFQKNGDAVDNIEERYVFYTYNHYNDFQEYLGYLGGFGDIFGNVTGGGTISSKTNYNPTPYITTVTGTLPGKARVELAVAQTPSLFSAAKDNSPLVSFEEMLAEKNKERPLRPSKYQLSPEAIERYETNQLRKEVLALYEAYLRQLRFEHIRKDILPKKALRPDLLKEPTPEEKLLAIRKALARERAEMVDERINDFVGEKGADAIAEFDREQLETLKSLINLRFTLLDPDLFIPPQKRPSQVLDLVG